MDSGQSTGVIDANPAVKMQSASVSPGRGEGTYSSEPGTRDPSRAGSWWQPQEMSETGGTTDNDIGCLLRSEY